MITDRVQSSSQWWLGICPRAFHVLSSQHASNSRDVRRVCCRLRRVSFRVTWRPTFIPMSALVDDTLATALSFLGLRTLCILRLVCRRWRTVSRTNPGSCPALGPEAVDRDLWDGWSASLAVPPAAMASRSTLLHLDVSALESVLRASGESGCCVSFAATSLSVSGYGEVGVRSSPGALPGWPGFPRLGRLSLRADPLAFDLGQLLTATAATLHTLSLSGPACAETLRIAAGARTPLFPSLARLTWNEPIASCEALAPLGGRLLALEVRSSNNDRFELRVGEDFAERFPLLEEFRAAVNCVLRLPRQAHGPFVWPPGIRSLQVDDPGEPALFLESLVAGAPRLEMLRAGFKTGRRNGRRRDMASRWRAALLQLSCLTSLQLPREMSLRKTPPCGQLTELSASLYERVRPLEFARVAGFPSLRRLVFRRAKLLVADDLRHLGSETLPDLTHLDLGGCSRVDAAAGLPYLARALSLRTLKLSAWKRVAGRDLAPLRGLQHLSALYLGRCPRMDDEGLAAVGAFLPRLSSLSLRFCSRILGPGLVHLQRLLALTRLDLSDMRRLVGGLGELAGCTALETLNLSHREYETGDWNLMAYPELTSSDVLGPEAMVNLAGCASLTHLNACRPRVAAVELARVAGGSRSLRVLRVREAVRAEVQRLSSRTRAPGCRILNVLADADDDDADHSEELWSASESDSDGEGGNRPVPKPGCYSYESDSDAEAASA